MSERDAVEKSSRPATVDSIKDDLRRLGVEPGMTLLVHSSLSAVGWVSGGPVAVIQALEAVLGPTGTLVMPTHSTGLTDPSGWQNPPVPQDWWPIFRETAPAYDPDLTPTRSMGAIAETFRKQRGVIRSSHPHSSFAAWGAAAAEITRDHALAFGMGEHSPLARLYDLGGHVLLLGVGYDNNSSLHLAEYRSEYPWKTIEKEGAPVLVEGKRQWVEFDELDLVSDDFEQIGQAFEKNTAEGIVRRDRIGLAECRLMQQRPLVDFAVGWMGRHRK